MPVSTHDWIVAVSLGVSGTVVGALAIVGGRQERIRPVTRVLAIVMVGGSLVAGGFVLGFGTGAVGGSAASTLDLTTTSTGSSTGTTTSPPRSGQPGSRARTTVVTAQSSSATTEPTIEPAVTASPDALRLLMVFVLAFGLTGVLLVYRLP